MGRIAKLNTAIGYYEEAEHEGWKKDGVLWARRQAAYFCSQCTSPLLILVPFQCPCDPHFPTLLHRPGTQPPFLFGEDKGRM